MHSGRRDAISTALREVAYADAHADLDGPIELLTEAVEIAAGSEARLEHCRALLELGTMLRRAGRRTDAGRALGEAIELARACGARPAAGARRAPSSRSPARACSALRGAVPTR